MPPSIHSAVSLSGGIALFQSGVQDGAALFDGKVFQALGRVLRSETTRWLSGTVTR